MGTAPGGELGWWAGARGAGGARGESVADCPLQDFFSLFLRSLKMVLGKLEGEFTWYLRDFLCFTNTLSFLLKKNH